MAEPQVEGDVEQYIPYHKWQQKEGIPSIRGLLIEDLNKVELKSWNRMGGPGAFVDLGLGIGIDGGGWLVEIPAGKSLNPLRHMFDEGRWEAGTISGDDLDRDTPQSHSWREEHSRHG